MVGENPDMHPGDVAGAREMLARVDAAIAHGGWTKNEWHRLHRMRVKWARRASGEDPRFMVSGTTGGATDPVTQHHRQLTDLSRIIRELSIKTNSGD